MTNAERDKPTGRRPGRPSNVFTLFMQEFVRMYVDHPSPAGASEAYRRAGGKGDPGSQVPKLLRYPQVQAAIAEHRQMLREKTKFTLEKAMEEAKEAVDFAKLHRSPMAYVKAVELRSKLSGLLIEKHDHRMVGSFTIQIEGIDDSAPIPIENTSALSLPPAVANLPPVEEPLIADFVDETAKQKTFEDLL